jgi:hypothetical protein
MINSGPRTVRIACVVTFAVALFVMELSMPSASADPMGGACQHVGTVRPSPGLNSVTKDFRFAFRGSVGPCQMTDGSTRWGIEFGSGTASGDCVFRTASAKWTIVWNTGERTVVDASFGGAGNVISTRGPVTKGEFLGSEFEDGHVLSGFSPMACLSDDGVTEATYQGAFVIG